MRIGVRTLLAFTMLWIFSGTLPIADAQERADWMRKAQWGVMTHFLVEWIAPAAHGSVEDWNRLVDNFDTERLAKQLDWRTQ